MTILLERERRAADVEHPATGSHAQTRRLSIAAHRAAEVRE
jgi:hypothetical protein